MSPLIRPHTTIADEICRVQQSYLLYAPLLDAGYRLLRAFVEALLCIYLTPLLDYIGKLDANTAWPGVLSTVCPCPVSARTIVHHAPVRLN